MKDDSKFLIDIGGTPEKILEKNNYLLAQNNGINPARIVAILDPFDLARAQRKLLFGEYKIGSINFSVNVPKGYTDLSSETVSPPKPDECKILFERARDGVIGKIQSSYGKRIKVIELSRKYDYFMNQTIRLAQDSKNLREFMNGIVKILAPDLRTVKLEEVLSDNYGKISKLLEKTDIPVRAICTNCNRFTDFYLRQDFPACQRCNSTISCREIMQTGRYIPQNGFFAVITFLCGYKTFSNSEDKAKQISEINNILGINTTPLLNFKETRTKRTLFEYFLLGEEYES